MFLLHGESETQKEITHQYDAFVVLGFNVPPTAKVIQRPDLGLKPQQH